MLWWWALAGIIMYVEALNWLTTLRLSPDKRWEMLPRLVRDGLWGAAFLIYALAHVGGPIGDFFAIFPQAPTWAYQISGAFLALEVALHVGTAIWRRRQRKQTPPPRP